MEKDAAQRKCQAIQIDQEVTEAELQDAYLQGKQPEKIQAATLRTRAAKYELNKTQQLEVAGFTSSSPNDPHYVKVLKRGNPISNGRSAPAGQTLAYTVNARHTPKLPDKSRHTSANTSSVASTNGHWHNDLIHCMVNTMLTENRDMIPKDSIIVKTKLSIVVVKEAWEVWEGWTGSGSLDSLRKQSK